MPPSRLLPCMAAPVPNSWKARCFSSMVPETHLATPSSAGWSAILTGILPRTAELGMDGLLHLAGDAPPEVPGVADLHRAVVDPEIDGRGRHAVEDDRV